MIEKTGNVRQSEGDESEKERWAKECIRESQRSREGMREKPRHQPEVIYYTSDTRMHPPLPSHHAVSAISSYFSPQGFGSTIRRVTLNANKYLIVLLFLSWIKWRIWLCCAALGRRRQWILEPNISICESISRVRHRSQKMKKTLKDITTVWLIIILVRDSNQREERRKQKQDTYKYLMWNNKHWWNGAFMWNRNAHSIKLIKKIIFLNPY